MPNKKQTALPVQNIKPNDKFWSPIQKLIADVVIPFQEDVLRDKVPGVEKSHAIENIRIAAGKSEGEFYGMVFQDSDVAKWLEAVAYSLIVKPDSDLENRADEVIDLIAEAQEDDGYLNTFFILKEPEKKWQNLQESHELYCNGHMIEAAVAYKQATGKDNLLNVMRKNADLICNRFGKDKIRGYPGHQEIELALLRLYRITGEKMYLDTAKYFIDERGTEPEFFHHVEAPNRGWVRNPNFKEKDSKTYTQVHAPVREQDKAIGHAVRAVYMYTAMADLAAETDDEGLMEACRVLWDNVTKRQMYITGGVGATVFGEAFSLDYELPNDLIYGETCASIAMVFFARQMLEAEANGEYADNMEKQLYNGVLSGMHLDGRKFFYVNPLEVIPGVSGTLPEYKHVKPERPGWFNCACCPPNVSRLYMSLGQYAWGQNDKGIFAHTYLGGSAHFDTAGGIDVECESSYPWEGNIKYTVNPKQKKAQFFFAVHIPGWCKKWVVRVNGKEVTAEPDKGYIYLDNEWSAGDTVELELDMQVQRMYSNTNVRADAGCVALQRGPIVYCFEEVDNGNQLSALRLTREAEIKSRMINDDSLGNVVVLETDGKRMTLEDELYSDVPPKESPVALKAIPYYAWGNRKLGGMRVWLLE